jgi:hypothetical protein
MLSPDKLIGQVAEEVEQVQWALTLIMPVKVVTVETEDSMIYLEQMHITQAVVEVADNFKLQDNKDRVV